MTGVSPKGLLDNCINTKSWYDRTVRIPLDYFRINDLLGRDNDSLACVNSFKVDPQSAPFLSVPFSVGSLNVDNANIGHYGFDDADSLARKRVFDCPDILVELRHVRANLA